MRNEQGSHRRLCDAFAICGSVKKMVSSLEIEGKVDKGRDRIGYRT